MSKHTPGPWHNSELGHQHNVRLVYAADGILVADAGRISHRSNDEMTANARLIAAAPELLESLEELLKCGTEEQVDTGIGAFPFPTSAAVKARAAIEKATAE